MPTRWDTRAPEQEFGFRTRFKQKSRQLYLQACHNLKSDKHVYGNCLIPRLSGMPKRCMYLCIYKTVKSEIHIRTYQQSKLPAHNFKREGEGFTTSWCRAWGLMAFAPLINGFTVRAQGCGPRVLALTTTQLKPNMPMSIGQVLLNNKCLRM